MVARKEMERLFLDDDILGFNAMVDTDYNYTFQKNKIYCI